MAECAFYDEDPNKGANSCQLALELCQQPHCDWVDRKGFVDETLKLLKTILISFPESKVGNTFAFGVGVTVRAGVGT